MSLEGKGLVERHVEERDGKLIKVAVITDKGKKLYDEILEAIRPRLEQVESIVNSESVEKMIKDLREFRKIIEKANKIVFE